MLPLDLQALQRSFGTTSCKRVSQPSRSIRGLTASILWDRQVLHVMLRWLSAILQSSVISDGYRGLQYPSAGIRRCFTTATVMRMTAIRTQTERKRLYRSAHHAEERYRRARKLRLRGPIHQVPAVCATATVDADRGEERLASWQNQVILVRHRR